MGAFFIPFGATGEAKFDLCVRRAQRPSLLGHCRAAAEATKLAELCESRRQYKKDPNRGRGCLKMGIPARRRE